MSDRAPGDKYEDLPELDLDLDLDLDMTDVHGASGDKEVLGAFDQDEFSQEEITLGAAEVDSLELEDPATDLLLEIDPESLEFEEAASADLSAVEAGVDLPEPDEAEEGEVSGVESVIDEGAEIEDISEVMVEDISLARGEVAPEDVAVAEPEEESLELEGAASAADLSAADAVADAPEPEEAEEMETPDVEPVIDEDVDDAEDFSEVMDEDTSLKHEDVAPEEVAVAGPEEESLELEGAASADLSAAEAVADAPESEEAEEMEIPDIESLADEGVEEIDDIPDIVVDSSLPEWQDALLGEDAAESAKEALEIDESIMADQIADSSKSEDEVAEAAVSVQETGDEDGTSVDVSESESDEVDEPAAPAEPVVEAKKSKGESWFKKLWKSLF